MQGTIGGGLDVFEKQAAAVDRRRLDAGVARLDGELEVNDRIAALSGSNRELRAELQRRDDAAYTARAISLEQAHQELMQAYDTTLEGWSRAMDMRDRPTEGHSQRVTEMTMRLARAWGLSEAELANVRRGALLHDIGKMGVPDSILLKPGPLSAEEWTVMRQHPDHAHELLYPIPFLRPALDIPYCHHEKWDGTGYPRGLVGEQIPIAARLFSAVDIWDALRFDRPYRPGWPEERVRQHLLALAGSDLDPQVVSAFLRLLGEP